MPSVVKQNNIVSHQTKMLKPEDLIPPNYDYLVLTISKITATYKTSCGKNSTLIMERRSLNEFVIIEGDTGVRWNNKKKIRRYSMCEWNNMYAYYRQRGWILYDTEKRNKVEVRTGTSSVNGKQYAPIKDNCAKEIVERLMHFANQMIEEEYTKAVVDVPNHAFVETKKCLDELAMNYETMTNADFNQRLMYVFALLPRRIDVLSKYIADNDASAEDRAAIIEEERERLDVLYTMLRGGDASCIKGNETILDVYGLEIRAFTDDEKDYAKRLLKNEADKFVNGWRIVNKKTERNFTTYCTKEQLSEKSGIDYLFHGSRHQNWWSIITNGLTINPIGVVITGKAYGQGTYFAPNAIKSLGYTSRRGSKYANGTEATGFMAIYKVATGKRYNGRYGCDSRLNWEKLQQLEPGAHCTWAESRYSGFIMDEVIVYRDEQSTIWGLIELKM